MKKTVALGLLVLVLTACAPAAVTIPPATLPPTVVIAARSSPIPNIQYPTPATPTPSATPTATPPPAPTATPTFVPEPWHVAGRRYYFPVQPPDIASYVNDHHDYPATDIFVPVGSTVVAVTDGVVNEVRRFDPWDPKTNNGGDRPGLFVAIVGDDGVRYHTSHLSAIEDGIEVGVRVHAGQIIARSGKTGNARNTPAHVHFGISRPLGPGDWEVRRGEVWPYAYLKSWAAGNDRTPNLPVYPWFEGPFIFGYSAGGRPLMAYRIGQGPVAKAIIGGIHGGYEINTTELVSQTLAYLKTRPEVIPLTVTLYIIPLLNPDGAALVKDAENQGGATDDEMAKGRFNAHGVDLNRNWDVGWEANAVNGKTPVDPGPRPFSEPETIALRNLLVSHRVQTLISYHSKAEAIYGDAALGKVMSKATGYDYDAGGIGYPTGGDLHKWCAANGILAVDIELTDHENIEWTRNRKGLLAFLAWSPPTRR